MSSRIPPKYKYKTRFRNEILTLHHTKTLDTKLQSIFRLVATRRNSSACYAVSSRGVLERPIIIVSVNFSSRLQFFVVRRDCSGFVLRLLVYDIIVVKLFLSHCSETLPFTRLLRHIPSI
jgi:hypothetical protein